MNTLTKIVLSLLLLAIALFSEGILALPAFVAFVAIWGIKL